MSNIFQQWGPTYREIGLWARPVDPGSKACRQRGWQNPDNAQPPGMFEKWMNLSGSYGLGLLMGTPISDGTFLGALDIDRDEYVELARVLLRNPVCGRAGKKGAVFFVRFSGVVSNPEFRVRGTDNASWGKVAECLFNKRLCVIPPTIHPDTRQPYRWIGTALHELDDLSTLPLIGA